MQELKPISENSIPKALTRAKHYRLLNEPWQAESICRDILKVKPDHQLAILLLILSITDQFGAHHSSTESEAKKLCEMLDSEYEQKYYRGIIAERSGKAAINRATPRAKHIAYDYYRSAMKFYEEAEKIHPKGNEDTILRWNACVRGIEKFKLHSSRDEERPQTFLDVF